MSFLKVLDNVDELIFKLCVLGGLSDDRGKLFLARKTIFVAIELLQAQVIFFLLYSCSLFFSSDPLLTSLEKIAQKLKTSEFSFF